MEARYCGEEIFQEETRVVRMDGSVIDVLFTTARPGAVANKSLVGFIDITERKKAEEALHERERELSQFVNIVPSHLWRLTPDGEPIRSEEHTSELQSLMRISYAVFCLK